MVPPAPCNEDLYTRHTSGQPMPARLPKDLDGAIDALQADSVLRAAVGEAFCAQWIGLKRVEWDNYAQHVSTSEKQRYADPLKGLEAGLIVPYRIRTTLLRNPGITLVPTPLHISH
jgi:hypothetical protein